MEKGKFGIRLSFYAVVAFLFVILGYSTPLFLLAGVVIVGEKDEWASRQVIQAICLQVVSGIVSAFFGIFNFMYSIPILGAIWGTTVGVVESLIDLVLLIFAIIAIVKTAKGKEAGVPLADKFANWAYGRVKVEPVYAQPAQAAPAAPVAPAAPAQPVQAAPADVCANCGTPLNGAAFCTKCGTPAAK